MSSATRRRAAAGEPDVDTRIRAFEAGEVDPEQFDHEEHVRTVWCYLQRYPLPVTIARFTSALRALTVRLGIPHKYHETISWFFIIVIAERVARSQSGDWEAFRKENADVLRSGSAVLEGHYSADRLHSAEARERFLLPDRVPT